LEPFFREFTTAINFPWLRILVNDAIFSKNTTRVEITKTISTAILSKYDKKLSSYIRGIFYNNCHHNFNPCGILEKMTSVFTQIRNQDLEQGKLMAAVNSRK